MIHRVILFASLAVFAQAALRGGPEAPLNTITCDGHHECPTNIECAGGADCTVQCIGDQACQEHRVFCPEGYACNIICGTGGGIFNSQNCQEADFVQANTTVPGTSFNLTCNADEACEGARILRDCDAATCSVTCVGDDKECHQIKCTGSGCPSSVPAAVVESSEAGNTIQCTNEHDCPDTIHCPSGADCTVDCIGDEACQQKRIFCPDGFGCTVNCGPSEEGDSDEFCEQADIVQGQGTGSTLALTCDGDESCEQARIDRECDAATCKISCSGDEACQQLECQGSGCP